MIPIRDNIPSRTTPVVNYSILVLCGVAFLLQLSAGSQGQVIVERYGMVPARLTEPGKPIESVAPKLERHGPYVIERKVVQRMPEPPFTPYLTLLTCIFLHGGWMHFLGNMLFLYIFGDNVEDRLGHVLYAVFYLAVGVLAGLSHYMADPTSTVPTIGASGAIAGVMGAYFLLYPHARVLTVIWVFLFLEFIVLPAWLLLGLWFALQLFQSWAASATPGAGGVAWWAHIGGFAIGAATVYLLKETNLLKRELPRAYPVTSSFRAYRGRSPW